jgi:transposase InsO family protein
MPWKETNKMDEKKEFIFRAWRSKETFVELCRKFGISTKTGYKWINRFREKGSEGLVELSRETKNNRNKMPEPVKQELLRLKRRYMKWGAYKIVVLYKNKHQGAYAPSASTVYELFKREGYTQKRKRPRKKVEERLQARVKATKANEVWTVDFKGWWWTPTDERCSPLTVRDEYSKYIIAIETPEKGDIPNVKAIFERLFKKYGLPEYIRSDNGPPFANVFNQWGLSKLSVWWMSLGIKIDLDDPHSPWQNGGHERMHRDMMQELEGKIDGDLRMHQKVFDKWRKEFNEKRPHEALKMKTPDEFYVKSERKWDGEETEIEYGGRMKSRQVNNRGYFIYKQRRYFVGNPFSGYNVGIKILKEGGLEIWFDNFKLGIFNFETGRIDVEKRKVNNRKSG